LHEEETNSALNAGINAAYELNTRFPVTLKSGVAFERRIHHPTTVNSRQWTRVASAPPLPDARLFATQFDERNPGRIPVVNPRASNAELSNPALWTENIYFREMARLSRTRRATEDIYGAYAMVRANINRLGVLAGVRTERTDVTGEGNVRRRPATAAQIPDPVDRANYDWGIKAKSEDRYTRSFPSIHFTYDITRNLKARASWSTSFGRPNQTQLLPNVTANDTNQTLTVANTGLGPQYSENIDVGIQYCFKPAGLLLRVFTSDRENIQLGFSYRWSPALTFTCDITNISDTQRKVYQYVHARLAEIRTPNQTITSGVRGRF
jgi:outer membrane receptor protein involved in Fe transport